MKKNIKWRCWGWVARVYDFIRMRMKKSVWGWPVEDEAESVIFKHRFTDSDGKEKQRQWRVVKRYTTTNPVGELLESDNPGGPYTLCEEIEK